MIKLVEEYFDVKNFFHAVADLEALRAQEKFVLPIITPEPIQKYWAQILQDLPEVPLAQERKRLYKQKSYKLSIAGSLMSDLVEKAQSNKLMLMAIYQAAWTYLLQQHNKTADITYTTLLPDKVTEDINTIPLRIKVEGTVIPQPKPQSAALVFCKVRGMHKTPSWAFILNTKMTQHQSQSCMMKINLLKTSAS